MKVKNRATTPTIYRRGKTSKGCASGRWNGVQHRHGTCPNDLCSINIKRSRLGKVKQHLTTTWHLSQATFGEMLSQKVSVFVTKPWKLFVEFAGPTQNPKRLLLEEGTPKVRRPEGSRWRTPTRASLRGQRSPRELIEDYRKITDIHRRSRTSEVSPTEGLGIIQVCKVKFWGSLLTVPGLTVNLHSHSVVCTQQCEDYRRSKDVNDTLLEDRFHF